MKEEGNLQTGTCKAMDYFTEILSKLLPKTLPLESVITLILAKICTFCSVHAARLATGCVACSRFSPPRVF
jgi:hypothetical protein